jgi:hypothetical protein
MSTSSRIVVAEAAGAAALVAGLVALGSPDDVWLSGVGLHPAWLAIIVVAARYGPRGLFPALGLTWGMLILLSLALGGSLEGLAVRARGTSDLLALVASILVTWIAMLHESRMARAIRRLGEATEAQLQAEKTMRALHDSLSYLRARHDRIDASLSLWRDLAARLERGDSVEAAKAVLELCAIRAGAAAGVVQLRDGNRLSTLAWRGQWSTGSARPSDISGDCTVRAAILSRRVTPASDGATEADSDVAVPVLDDGGTVVGVIALRGVSPGSLRAPDMHDLVVIAQWLAPALDRSLEAAAQRKKTAPGAR